MSCSHWISLRITQPQCVQRHIVSPEPSSPVHRNRNNQNESDPTKATTESFKLNIQLLMLMISFFAVGQSRELKRFESTEALMGVQFTVIVYAQDAENASNAINAAFDEIEAMEKSLSDYRAESEINLLCQSAPHEESVPVSQYLFETHALAKTIFVQTDGAFDITVGSASQVWRNARRDGRLPSQESIDQARSKMGMKQIQSNQNDRGYFMKVSQPGMQWDFGGVAKGRAADLAMKALQDRGIKSALINASGDVLVSDPPPGRDGWTIQIPSQDANQKSTITLSNAAVATSGDVYQYLEVDGVRYSHIIDPQTATAVTTPRIVTVIHKNGGSADAYSSALSVMGTKGLELAEECQFQAQIISATNSELTEFEVHRTDGFPKDSP